ncbi:hypothetical protein [Klebsiella pneumoniae]|uniref:Uncharacterized protein n=1 Tax=Klebsiella pneumoniae TaxID=573 RepID=A0A927E5C5_KLEPN|nr:hypothetical protein [Klebsiella pneumoniae]MBD3697271.1 hypothetical protein [Klebsiella pneumoniae]MBD3743785.1 hypothetical protein [Klebsiella pneumoniae]MCS6702120.1 hypothetical protein [Klebsiella pneumoniae subsp. pneumoniae]MCY0628419.1 hypothetical protein [Klebsiella pneumoniae]QDJ77772.1 hypothetical protein CI667_0015185 [Klebsiella pneumoniae subsp. pneumoniae]
MQITSAANNYLYRRITTVGLYNEAAALPFARRKFRIFPGFTDKKAAGEAASKQNGANIMPD